MNRKIMDHVHKTYHKYSKDHLHEALLALGFKDGEIEEAITEVGKEKRHHEIFGPDHHKHEPHRKESLKKAEGDQFILFGIIFGFCFWAIFFAILFLING